MLRSGKLLRASSSSRRLYELLRVSATATDKEIKDSFKKLALKHHPDRGGDAEAFKEIAQAYEVLSDPEKRRRYDLGSEESEFPGNFRSAQRRKTPAVLHRLEIPLEEFFTGARKFVKFQKKFPCHPCDGLGGEAQQCGQCGGVGVFYAKHGNFLQQIPCAACDARGFVVTRVCGSCRGSGTAGTSEILEISVSPGDLPGERKIFPGRGDQQRGFEPGDVVIGIFAQPHRKFLRIGNSRDLFVSEEISFRDSVTKSEISVEFLGERKILVTSDQLLAPGQILRVPGHGLPGGGDLYVQISVKFPSSRAEAAAAMAQALREPPGERREGVRGERLTETQKRRVEEALRAGGEEETEQQSAGCTQQ